jgi:predicted nicotinamide N-methyase
MPALRYRRQTIHIGARHIRLRTLQDNQQFEDPSGEAEALGISSATWPLFGVIWPAGEVLARLMAKQELAGQRILEVGCGIGLASLLLNQRAADVSATDQHPYAGRFLRHNINLNHDRQIPFERRDWGNGPTTLGKFDLIIGSDLLYERNHAALLSQFVDAHAQTSCEVIIIDPGRGNAGRFTTLMANRGYSKTQSRPAFSELSKPFSGRALRFQRGPASVSFSA